MPILRCKLTFGLSLLLLSFKHVQNWKCKCSLGTELLCNELRRIGNALLSSGCEYQQKFSSSILPSSVNFGQTQMLCLLYFILGTKSQSDNNSPQLGQTGYISSLGDLSFSLQLFDWNAAPETCTRSPMQTHFPSCAKFYIQLWNWMIFLQTISIIRKCYPSLFAHFHNALLHIILIFPLLWLKQKQTSRNRLR